MRKLTAAEFLASDGFIAGANGDMDWRPAKIDPDELIPKRHTILLGHVTCQRWLNFRPNAPAGQKPRADFTSHASKLVFSRTLDAAPRGYWNNARLVNELTPAVIYGLKEQQEATRRARSSGCTGSVRTRWTRCEKRSSSANFRSANE